MVRHFHHVAAKTTQISRDMSFNPHLPNTNPVIWNFYTAAQRISTSDVMIMRTELSKVSFEVSNRYRGGHCFPATPGRYQLQVAVRVT